MTTAKIATKLSNQAMEGLGQYVPGLYANPGKRVVAIVELAHIERNQPAPDEDKEATVTLGIKHLEIANPEQENTLRQALRALYTLRTAYGSLTETADVELGEETLRRCAGEITAIEAARLHVAIDRWAEFASKVLHDDRLSAGTLRQELRTLADGLRSTIYADTLVKG